jgi:cell division protein FtsB
LGIPSNIDVEALQKENESLRAQVQKLTKQVEELNKKLQQQPAAASAAALGQSS